MNYYFQKRLICITFLTKPTKKEEFNRRPWGMLSIFAGEHITNLEAIKPVIKRVTEKHRAIGVKPEQYPVVGETLLQAVKDVLGDIATDEIIEAWGKAYGYIADAFIDIEKTSMRKQNISLVDGKDTEVSISIKR